MLSWIAGLGGWDSEVVDSLDGAAQSQLALASLGSVAACVLAGFGVSTGITRALDDPWVGRAAGVAGYLLCLATWRFIEASGGIPPAFDEARALGWRRARFPVVYLGVFTFLLMIPLMQPAVATTTLVVVVRASLLAGLVVVLILPRFVPSRGPRVYELARWEQRRLLIAHNHLVASQKARDILYVRFGVHPDDHVELFEDPPFNQKRRESPFLPPGSHRLGRPLAEIIRIGLKRGPHA
jgi:hypothetical protein